MIDDGHHAGLVNRIFRYGDLAIVPDSIAAYKFNKNSKSDSFNITFWTKGGGTFTTEEISGGLYWKCKNELDYLQSAVKQFQEKA